MSEETTAPSSGGEDGIRGSGPRRSWPRRHRGAVAAAAFLALAGAAAGTWATDTWPFAKERYCWGAWEQDSGPKVLGDSELEASNSTRTARESAAPTRQKPRATCTLTVTSSIPDDHGGDEGSGSDTIDFTKTVTVTYDSPPENRSARLEWYGDYLDGSVSPLPDGVPGLVSQRKGMLVLPERCDVDGRPGTVTIEAKEHGDGHLGRVDVGGRIGTEYEVAQLLLAAANTGMRQAGCAPDEPLRITSPVGPARELESDSVDDTTCGIRGFAFRTGKDDHYDAASGAVDDNVQLCFLTNTDDVRNPRFAGQFVMVTEPRLRALFDGFPVERAPGAGWRGVGRLGEDYQFVEAECGSGRRAAFFLRLTDGGLAGAAGDTRQIFGRTVNSVAERIGCPAVAPTTPREQRHV
ncbi:hypothetical protein [Streptomyces sp. NPDC002851]